MKNKQTSRGVATPRRRGGLISRNHHPARSIDTTREIVCQSAVKPSGKASLERAVMNNMYRNKHISNKDFMKIKWFGWAIGFAKSPDGLWTDSNKIVRFRITRARPVDEVLGFSMVFFCYHFGLCRLRKK